MRRSFHILFCLVWATTAGVFLALAIDAKLSENTTLTRFDVPSTGAIIRVGNFDPVKLFEALSEAFDENAGRLETSIRHTAKLNFWLDVVSFSAALVGLSAQIGTMIRDHRDEQRAHRNLLNLLIGVFWGLGKSNPRLPPF